MYRVWDDDYKVMIYDLKAHFSKEYNILYQEYQDSGNVISCVSWDFVDHAEYIMRRTEYKDRLDNYIYEGDIVVGTIETEGYGDDKPRRFQRVVEAHLSTNIDNEWSGGWDAHIEYYNLKVIGNKWETPELLEGCGL